MPPSRPATVTSRQPIRPGKDSVAERELVTVTPRAIDDVEPERLQTAGTRTRSGLGVDDVQRNTTAVERQVRGLVRDVPDIPRLRISEPS